MDLIFVGFFAMLALAIGLYVVSVPQDGRVWWGLAAAIVVLVIASKLIDDARIAAVFLALAEFAAVALLPSLGVVPPLRLSYSAGHLDTKRSAAYTGSVPLAQLREI
jgi:hypothetical protein